MTIVNIHEAKTHLSALIKKAIGGEEVIIANKRKPGLLKGKIKIIGDWKQSDKEVEDLLLDNL